MAPPGLTEFSSADFRTFLTTNDLSFMIRSHSTIVKPEDGYELHFTNKCLTVSSATDTPTVLFLDPGKKLHCTRKQKPMEDVSPTIRFVQLDLITDPSSVTSNGPSSMKLSRKS